MEKKIGVFVIFLAFVICLSAPLFAEDTAVKPDDASSQPAQNVETPEPAMPGDEELMPAEEGVGEGVVTGEVTSLDAASGAITVKSEDGSEKAFSVVDGETILWKGIEDIKLADIKQGDKAEVGYYTDDAGKLIASWVDIIVPEPAEPQAVPGALAPGVTSEE